MKQELLKVTDLHISFKAKGEPVRAVTGVTFSVAKGETIQTVTQEELRSYLLQMFGGESNSEEKKENNSDKNK